MLKTPNFEKIQNAIKVLSQELGLPEHNITDLLLGQSIPTDNEILEWAKAERKSDLALHASFNQ